MGRRLEEFLESQPPKLRKRVLLLPPPPLGTRRTRRPIGRQEGRKRRRRRFVSNFVTGVVGWNAREGGLSVGRSSSVYSYVHTYVRRAQGQRKTALLGREARRERTRLFRLSRCVRSVCSCMRARARESVKRGSKESHS